MPTRFEEVVTKLTKEPVTWLVTGAAGFIGSHLCEALLQLGQRVRGVDNFSTGKRTNLEAIKGSVGDEKWARFEFFEADCSDESSCVEAIGDAQIILHQAALGSVPRSIEAPLSSHRANATGFITLLDSARRARVQRFVYASSSSVYGDSPKLPKKETDRGTPLSPYAATKAINELYATVWSNVYGVESIGLRYFNVFGVRQDPNGAYAAVIPRWLNAALREEQCVIFGDGTTSRDFCYIENVIQANLLAAMAPREATGRVYNIALGDRTTLLELHELLWDNVCKVRPKQRRLAPQFAPTRAGDVVHSLADITQAVTELGYAPQVRIAEGIARLVEAQLAARGTA